MADLPEAATFNFRSYHAHSNTSQPYYVQSPSPHSRPDYSPAQNSLPDQPSRFSLSILSRCSSSQNSITSEKPTVHFKTHSSATVVGVDDEEGLGLDQDNEQHEMVTVRDMLVKHEYEYEEECYYERRRGCFRYLTIGRNSSSGWICLQLGLRVVVSLSLALLVFYIATKPPRPHVSIQIGGISRFELGEGVDRTGIPTKILRFNSSIHLLIDNKSKVFGLQLHHPHITLHFGQLLLAISRGFEDENVEPYQTAIFKLTVGTRYMPMYGAGRSMQDMLESGKGVPLEFKLMMKSNYHVLGSLINLEFLHKGRCEVFFTRHYNEKHHTQSFNSSWKV